MTDATHSCSRPIVKSACALLVFVLGCGKSAVEPITPPSTAGQPDAAVVGSLEAAGAQISRDAEGRVTAVDLRSVDANDEIAQSLSQLPMLTRLTLDTSSMSLDGWLQLSQLEQMQHLDLRGCAVNNEQLAIAVGGMSKLRSLRLNGTSGQTTVDDAGLAILGQCPNLVLLAVDGLWVSEAGLAHIATPTAMKELYLAQTLVEDAAMSAIAAMPALQKLRLANTGVTNAGMAQLIALPLEDLDISECSQLDDAAMASVGKMTKLSRLNLWRDAITDAGVEQLSGLVNMQWLNLDNTRLSDIGLQHLENMQQLTFLHLGSTAVTDLGMPRLAGLKSLRDLKVTRTAVTEEGVEVLRQQIPGIEIQLKYIEGQ